MTNSLVSPYILIVFLLLIKSASAQLTNLKEDYSAYLPEVRAFNRQLRTTIPLPDSSAKTSLHPTVRFIQGPAGKLALRVFRPNTIRAVVLDIHGGGWVAGMAAFNDPFNDEMARRCQVAVVSVDYRLAPDNPFPACLDDCKAAAKWLVDHGINEFDTDKLFMSGQSAGGHLAALTTLYIRDSLQAIHQVKGVNLAYGCFDLSCTPSCRMATDSTLILSKEGLDYVWEHVFPAWSQEQKRNPRYSPLYADLKNLPPAFFTIGTVDPFIDDTFFMEARWRLAGNKTFLAVYPESPHAFNSFPTKMARAANQKIFQWITSLCAK